MYIIAGISTNISAASIFSRCRDPAVELPHYDTHNCEGNLGRFMKLVTEFNNLGVSDLEILGCSYRYRHWRALSNGSNPPLCNAVLWWLIPFSPDTSLVQCWIRKWSNFNGLLIYKTGGGCDDNRRHKRRRSGDARKSTTPAHYSKPPVPMRFCSHLTRSKNILLQIAQLASARWRMWSRCCKDDICCDTSIRSEGMIQKHCLQGPAMAKVACWGTTVTNKLMNINLSRFFSLHSGYSLKCSNDCVTYCHSISSDGW